MDGTYDKNVFGKKDNYYTVTVAINNTVLEKDNSAEAQYKCGGFDHAGKYESSLMCTFYPDHVDLERTKANIEWLVANAVETSLELGQHMVQCALKSLEKISV